VPVVSRGVLEVGVGDGVDGQGPDVGEERADELAGWSCEGAATLNEYAPYSRLVI
jgi:hypothetical protein